MFCSLRHEKKNSNVEYLALKKIFITALAAQTAQTLKLMNSNLAYNQLYIKLGSQTSVLTLWNLKNRVYYIYYSMQRNELLCPGEDSDDYNAFCRSLKKKNKTKPT